MFVHSLAGLGFGLSLIVAIGAQNMFVLRQGLRREHVGVVVAICALSDALLISAGVAGAGALLAAVPRLDTALRWGGAAFLTAYALLAARRALHPTEASLTPTDHPAPAPSGSGLSAIGPSGGTLSSVGSSSVGPSDVGLSGGAPSGVDSSGVGPSDVGSSRAGRSKVARGGVAAAAGTAIALTWLNPHVYLDTVALLGSVASGRGGGRWWFGAGAILGSVAWFTLLGYGAGVLRPLLARPNAWRVLDGVIAAVMLAIAVSLVAGAR